MLYRSRERLSQMASSWPFGGSLSLQYVSTNIPMKQALIDSTPYWVITCVVLIYDLFLASAVIVGCLPPFKSLFKSHRSFQRYRSPIRDKNSIPRLRLDPIRLGRTRTGSSPRAAWKITSKPIDREQHVFDGSYGGGYGVPRGAIGVRTDYVSCSLSPREKD